MGGFDPDGPQTRGTSCAIPSWNVPKSIFGEREMEKVSPKIVSPNKEAVFFLIDIFFENGIRIKCHQIGMDQKVSPNNNDNGDNFYLMDIV
jgi:hypothetical protein